MPYTHSLWAPRLFLLQLPPSPEPHPRPSLQVADFGKARLLSADGIATAGSYATITHMSPEYIRDKLLSPAADVYAFGVLLWQMFTGKRPWAGLSHAHVRTVLFVLA
jgi:serine/threonine protein kinase